MARSIPRASMATRLLSGTCGRRRKSKRRSAKPRAAPTTPSFLSLTILDPTAVQKPHQCPRRHQPTRAQAMPMSFGGRSAPIGFGASAHPSHCRCRMPTPAAFSSPRLRSPLGAAGRSMDASIATIREQETCSPVGVRLPARRCSVLEPEAQGEDRRHGRESGATSLSATNNSTMIAGSVSKRSRLNAGRTKWSA